MLVGQPELSSWLDEAHDSGTKVIFVSLGADVIWQPWYGDVICKGIKELAENLQVKAVIDMPETFKEYTNKHKELFFVAEGLPQAEILKHPAVAVGLSAGDFVSAMDHINSGVPMLCFPHFGD